MAFHGNALNVNKQKDNAQVKWGGGVRPNPQDAAAHLTSWCDARHIHFEVNQWVEVLEDGTLSNANTDANGNYTPDFRVTDIMGVNAAGNDGAVYIDIPNRENILVYVFPGIGLKFWATRIRALNNTCTDLLILA